MTGHGWSRSWRPRTGATPAGRDEPRRSGPCAKCRRTAAVLAYGLGMPARKRPTPQDAATARRILLDGLARDADIVELVSELAPLHLRNNTFPGEVFLRLAAGALDWCRASREQPLALEGIRERFLPEAGFRGRQNHKLQFAVLAAAACAAAPSRICSTRSPGGRPTTSGNTPRSQRSPTSVPPPTGPVCLCARHASRWPSPGYPRHNYHSRASLTAVGGLRSPRISGGTARSDLEQDRSHSVRQALHDGSRRRIFAATR